MKKRYLFILFILPFLLISSCKRLEDPIFDENASIRMTAAVEEAYAVLQGNKAGWMMKYFPSREREFGGYTIFAKFISNAQVTLTSDVNTNVLTSTYAVVPEMSATLTFNGYNKIIHLFSEPGADNGGIGNSDTGMKGDFEFVIQEATPERVVLKGKKSGNEIVMLPLQGDEFETMPADFYKNSLIFSSLENFTLERANGEIKPLRYSRRVLQGLTDDNSSVSFRVIPNGLEFYEEVEIGGVRVKTLDFEGVPGERRGYYTNKDQTFKIYVSYQALNKWFINNRWSLSYNNVGEAGRETWDIARTNFQDRGVVLNNVYFGPYEFSYGLIGVLDNSVVALFVFDTTLSDTDDDIVKTDFGNWYFYWQVDTFDLNKYWFGGLNQIAIPFFSKVFQITGDDSVAPSELLLTDVSNPQNTMRVTLDPISDPLNN